MPHTTPLTHATEAASPSLVRRLLASMLRLAALVTASALLLQLASAGVHAHDDDATTDAPAHDTCAACVFASAAPGADPTPDCPAAPTADLRARGDVPRVPTLAARRTRPPARAPPALLA